jgi:hypothetical protein
MRGLWERELSRIGGASRRNGIKIIAVLNARINTTEA